MTIGRGYFRATIERGVVLTLLAALGMIQRLDFGSFILLRPEVLSRCAAAVVRKVRKYPQELGCIREDDLLARDLDYQDFKRLPREDEAVVFRTQGSRFARNPGLIDLRPFRPINAGASGRSSRVIPACW